MSERQPTLLVSARDPGAAHSLLPVLEAAREVSPLRAVAVAQAPALDLWRGRGIPAFELSAPVLSRADAPELEVLFTETRALLDRVKPDALLTGLSGPGLGIDEALVSLAEHRLVYSLQDLSGLVVPGFGRPAPVYFVADEAARKLTERVAGVEAVAVGHVKYAGYRLLPDPAALREEGRRALPRGNPLVAVYGQPAWHLEGYAASLFRFAEALRGSVPDAQVVYRPHPKEHATQVARTLSFFEAFPAQPLLDPNPRIEISLAASDLAVSCFSTCGIDHVFLNRYASSPLGTGLFLAFHPDIIAANRGDCGYDVPPEVDAGLVAAARDPGELPSLLPKLLLEESRRENWKRIHANLLLPDSSPKAVLRRICADLGLA